MQRVPARAALSRAVDRLRPPGFVPRPRHPCAWLGLVLLAFGLTIAGATVQADSYDDRRARAGARLFRSLLAADVALESKAAPDGALHVIVYGGESAVARELAELIAPADAEQSRIRGLPLTVTARDDLPGDGDARPVGLFLAGPLNDAELQRLVRWGIDRHVILYSPFEGDVERGALAGISIEAKVQPYLNLATLEASGIELKPFFMRVAKVHK